jgi:tetratricopeptide (TPR) repeat protein
MKSAPRNLAAPIALMSLSLGAYAGPGVPNQVASGELGTVSFEISCRPAVKQEFNRGVALLHSFWYGEAQRAFEKVAAADPECAMAYWGEAMTHFPQVNGWPDAAAAALAERVLARGDAAHESTPREAGYLHALHAFYDGFTPGLALKKSEAYAKSMAKLSHEYPDDLEAHVFYALALLASDAPDDVQLINPRKAYAILAPLFRDHPDHPGIAHYILHACDNPSMARDGLEAARRFAAIAPASPHALHMPGHIFARLGLWQDDIHSNLASKAAAESTSGMHMGAENRLHAMEFLEYAYLQTGQDDEAHAILDEAKTVQASDVDPRYPEYYAQVEARYPALYAIETRDWVAAAHLNLVKGAGYLSQGLTLLAHAMAAGHLHDAEKGQEAYQTFAARIAEAGKPLDASVSRLRDEILAWADFSAQHVEAAAGLLHAIADRQAKVGKGEVELPAREMLADMLRLAGQPAEALKEYQASLLSDPNRFNALLGAGEAAEQLGLWPTAARFYRTLLSNCALADGTAREELVHAQRVVTDNAALAPK